MHSPGQKSAKVFTSGLHCTHGIMAMGVTNSAVVTIAN